MERKPAIAILGLVSLCWSGCAIPVPIPGTELLAIDLEGKVVDSATGRPVDNASVMWEGLPKTKDVSDDEGSFMVGSAQDFYLGKIVNPGGHTSFPQTRHPASALVVSHPDYKPSSTSLFDILGMDGTPPDGPILIKLVPK